MRWIHLLLLIAVPCVSRWTEARDVDPYDLSLEELAELSVIVDVASLFDESALVVGSTVGLVTRDNWRRRSARTVGDALGHLPSVAVLGDFFGGSHIAIRGFALNAATGVAANLDGVPINGIDLGNGFTNSNGLQLGVLDRIEMVLGPGSSVYGPDAFHGVVALEAFESTRDVIEAEGGFGSDGSVQLNTRSSHGLSQTLRYSAALAYSGQPPQDVEYTYTDPDTLEPGVGQYENEYDGVMATLKLHSDPDRPVAFRAGVYLNDQQSHDFPGLGTSQTAGVSVLRDRDLSGGESRFGMLSGAVVFKLGAEVSAEADAFYWRSDQLRLVDRTAQLPPPPFVPAFIEVDNDVERGGVNLVFKQPTNRLSTQWVVGIGYEEAEVRIHRQRFFSPDGELVSASKAPQDGIRRRTRSFFAQARTSLFEDKVHVLYGGRVDNFSDFGTQTSPRVGLVYQPSATSAIKLLYGEAFRPSTSAEIGGSPSVLGDPTLDPETIATTELVFIKQFEFASANVTLFRSNWKDAIAIVPVDGMGTINSRRANVGEKASQGVEVSTQFFWSRLNLLVSGSYVRARDTTDDVRLDAFPELIFNLGIGYELSDSVDVHLVTRAHLGADEGGVVVDPLSGSELISPEELRDYLRADLRLSWRPSSRGPEAYVGVLNIFDRDNYLPSTNNAEGGIPDVGITALFGLRWVF